MWRQQIETQRRSELNAAQRVPCCLTEDCFDVFVKNNRSIEHDRCYPQCCKRDSCYELELLNGFPLFPLLASHSNQSHMHKHKSARGRVAYEVTGCLRNISASTSFKVQNVADLVQNGWHVDLYCVLEACSEAESELAKKGAVREFGEALVKAGAILQNCTFSNNTMIDHLHTADIQERRSTFTTKICRVERRMLSMLHKWFFAQQLRLSSGKSYDFVWRNRPDFVATFDPSKRGALWTTMRDRAGFTLDGLHQNGAYYMGAALQDLLHEQGNVTFGTASYLVPATSVCPCGGGHPTDMEAILPVANGAAAHYSNAFNRLPLFFTTQRPPTLPHPETAIHTYMRLGGYRPLTVNTYSMSDRILLNNRLDER